MERCPRLARRTLHSCADGSRVERYRAVPAARTGPRTLETAVSSGATAAQAARTDRGRPLPRRCRKAFGPRRSTGRAHARRVAARPADYLDRGSAWGPGTPTPAAAAATSPAPCARVAGTCAGAWSRSAVTATGSSRSSSPSPTLRTRTGTPPALAELRASIGRCPLCGGTHLGRPSQGGRVVKRLRCPRCSERLLQTAGGHWA
jgi:predicted RNA-binding Zn-ribbon protein involved in translation (DUF1610 family)